MKCSNAPTLRRSNALKSLSLYLATIGGCALFVLLSIRLAPPAQAQSTPTPTPTCPPQPTPTATPITSCTPNTNGTCGGSPCSPTPYPSVSPPIVDIPEAFQPKDANGQPTGVRLQWRVLAPSPTPSAGKGPCVLLLHEGHFATGNILSGSLTDPINDLNKAGYYVFVAAYRLAPCGLITGQACHDDPTSGRPPEQTDDVKAFMRAMAVDGHCNGKRAIVGGSGGGSHAAFCAFDKSVTTIWPFWNSGGIDDRPDVVACLSGAYDFADRTPENYPPSLGDVVYAFQLKIENYTNTCIRIDPAGGPSQRTVSPIYLIDANTPTNFKPMFFINSQWDSMPFHQIIDIQCALEEVGVSPTLYEAHTIPLSDEHAFAYWNSPVGTTAVLAKTLVISFLDAHLK